MELNFRNQREHNQRLKQTSIKIKNLSKLKALQSFYCSLFFHDILRMQSDRARRFMGNRQTLVPSKITAWIYVSDITYF